MGHYETLGISQGASVDEIKKAYRALARINHPDKGGDAEEFKKINQAYETLSDPDARARYDQFGEDGGPGGPGPGSGPDMSHIFEQMFGGGGGRRPGGVRGDHQHVIELTLDEVYTGVTKNMKITTIRPCFECLIACSTCGGTGMMSHMQHMGIMAGMFQSPCQACQGVGRVPKGCHKCDGKRHVKETVAIGITVPAGVPDGHGQRISGLGDQPRTPNERPGDLIVVFRVKRHPVFERHGDNLKYTLTITFEESVNGHEFTIPHFGGPFSFNTIDLGAAIDPRREYPIKGRGLTKDGTLYVQFDIQYPRDPSTRFNLVSREP